MAKHTCQSCGCLLVFHVYSIMCSSFYLLWFIFSSMRSLDDFTICFVKNSFWKLLKSSIFFVVKFYIFFITNIFTVFFKNNLILLSSFYWNYFSSMKELIYNILNHNLISKSFTYCLIIFAVSGSVYWSLRNK